MVICSLSVEEIGGKVQTMAISEANKVSRHGINIQASLILSRFSFYTMQRGYQEKTSRICLITPCQLWVSTDLEEIQPVVWHFCRKVMVSDISIRAGDMVKYTVSAVTNYLLRRKIMGLSCISDPLITHTYADSVKERTTPSENASIRSRLSNLCRSILFKVWHHCIYPRD